MKGFVLLILFLFVSGESFGQSQPEKAGKMEDGKFILTVNLQWGDQEREKLMQLFDLDSLLLHAVFEQNVDFVNDSTEWTARILTPGLLELSKIMTVSVDTLNKNIFLSGMPEHMPPPIPVPVTYGVNDFRVQDSFQYEEDRACFFLPGNDHANGVFLSGSFNQWSTMQLPMQRTDTGWVACIQLPPGKHLYKFIIDGRWTADPNNRLKENDGHRGRNSVVYCYNHVFRLDNHLDANRVLVSGSFNSWRERELSMNKTATGWELPLFLREGTHAYKFIVDGNWILDPENPVTRSDGRGNNNSFVGVGDTLYFTLKGFEQATRVVISGSFNAWNTEELLMEPAPQGWSLPYVLAAGNHEYKYIVDGMWITDPGNPFSVGSGEFKNSFLAYKPNHMFVLTGFPEAEVVIVAGSFNGWNSNEYRMVFRNGNWEFPVYLSPGRHSYKFVVDGHWIEDPHNTLKEQNEFGGWNSVLWIE